MTLASPLVLAETLVLETEVQVRDVNIFWLLYLCFSNKCDLQSFCLYGRFSNFIFVFSLFVFGAFVCSVLIGLWVKKTIRYLKSALFLTIAEGCGTSQESIGLVSSDCC